MDPTTRKSTLGVTVSSMIDDIRPVLETTLTRDPSKCVIAYTRDDGHYDVWVYARDLKTGNLSRCLAYRTFRRVSAGKWDLRYEIGDLDEKTRTNVLSLIQRALAV